MSDIEQGATEKPDAELTAIQTIISALAGLDPAAKDRVFDYVFRRLGIARPIAASAVAHAPAPPAPVAPAHIPMPHAHSLPTATASDVRTFAATKQPHTDTERVAVVAYYLAEVGTGDDKKATVTSEDITKYFKQAGFPLPARPRQTLHNAKNAGYFDAAAETGAYKLNPVGHNLVVHGLPSSAAKTTKSKLKPKKKSAGK